MTSLLLTLYISSLGLHADPCIFEDVICPNEIQTPEEMIISIGKEEGFTDDEIETLYEIAWCESRFNPAAQNKQSSAAGLFQIIRGTWLAYSDYDWSERYDAEANIRTAIKIFKKRGTRDWVCR